VRDDHDHYVNKVVDRLRAIGARVSADPADEPLGARIRQAKQQKLPYILVVGDDDVGAGTVGVNRRGSGAPERGVELTTFTEMLEREIASRTAPETA
jgi:threonyl-tRNA synthetase